MDHGGCLFPLFSLVNAGTHKRLVDSSLGAVSRPHLLDGVAMTTSEVGVDVRQRPRGLQPHSYHGAWERDPHEA